MANKKILVLVTRLLETGGIESHIKEFFTQFQSEPIDLYLLVLDSRINDSEKKRYQDCAKKVWLIKSNSLLIRQILVLKIIPQLINLKFDTIYSNGQGNSLWYLKNIISKNANWVHHHHTSGELQDQNTWQVKYIETLKHCNTLIACTNYSASIISSKINRKVISIPCFSREIDTHKIESTKPHPIKLAYFGRLIAEKGIDILCQLSLEKNIDFEIHIWGHGEKYPSTHFNLYPNLKYHGSFSSKKELKEIANKMDGFILISKHPEGLPISLLEVMSAGLPWMASGSEGIKEIATDSNLNILFSKDITYKELLSLISKFVTKIKELDLAAFSIRQKAIYKSNYSAESIKNKWFDVLS